MAQRRLLKRGTALLTWTFLLIVVPLAIYAVSVFDQRVHVRANNLRTLSKATDTTAELFQTLLRNVRNLDGKCDKRFVDEFLKRQPRLARVDDYSQCKKPLNVKRSAELRVTADGVEVWSTQYESTDDEKQKDYLKFTVRLDDVLAEIPFGDVLDLLLIADDAGKVIEQRRPKGRVDIGLKLASLSGLTLVDGGATLASADLQRSSTVRTVRVAGADYELLCQPLNVGFVLANDPKPSSNVNTQSPSSDSPPQVSGAQRQFVMCGLVASQSGLEQALRVAPFLALFLFAAIIFAFLSWPMLKLVLMSERDRLHFSDLCFLLIGTWTALMLATILILGLGVHQQLRARSAGSLEDLAARIETNLRGEVDELTVRLADWDESLARLPGRIGLKGLPDISNFYGEVQTTFADTAGSEHLSFDWKSWRPPSKPDFFVRAFWADCNDKGNQVFKVALAKTNTTRLSLENREYFQAVRQDRLWAGHLGPTAGSKKGLDLPRFVQSVRSLTTGEFGTVVSLKSTIGPPRGACAAMAAIEAKLVTTTHPVLSPGVGFAIIDEKGAVVLHSDERRAGFENLYDEMDDGKRLRAIVLSRQAEVFATTYLDRPHQVFVRPLTEFPWFVVTFADTEMIATTSLEIIGHAFVLVVVELLLFILVMGLYWIIKGSEIPRWFWPKAHRPEWSARILVPALVAFVFAGLLVDGDALGAVAILIPLVVVTALYLVYCRRAARGGATVGGLTYEPGTSEYRVFLRAVARRCDHTGWTFFQVGFRR